MKSTNNYDIKNPQWDPKILGAQEPAAQAGQILGGYIADFINDSVEKHKIDLVVELLGG